jgi:hypothetical protein
MSEKTISRYCPFKACRNKYKSFLVFIFCRSYRPASVQLKMQGIRKALSIVGTCLQKEPAYKKKIKQFQSEVC